MKNITPAYMSYRGRVIKGLPKILILSSFLTLLIFVTDVNNYRIAAFVCLGGIIIFNFYKLLQRSKKYIKCIQFSETLVELTIIDSENESVVISSKIEDIRIKLVELFFGFNRIGRNFKLQIDIRKNGKFEKVFEQYEIGGWNIELFKKSYVLYSGVKSR